MTDSDLMSRARAYDGDTLAAWTPEEVGRRMIEAAAVISKIPAKVGPARLASVWPVYVRTAQDLVDEQTQLRLMRFPHLVGEWEARVDDKTKRQLSRDTQEAWERMPDLPGSNSISRAEEALHWPARYLGARPLLADALTTWAFCIGTGASLRATLRRRCEDADKRARLLPGSRRQEIMPGTSTGAS
jgi:hypothetical protein